MRAYRASSYQRNEDAETSLFAMKFSKVYPFYVQKAERKNRSKKEVDQIICWLTGYRGQAD
jgi:hypothetical protein